MRIRDRNGKDTAILVFESKTQVDHSKHRNTKRSEKCYVLIFKKTHERRKDIGPMDFAEDLSLLK